MMAGKEWWLPNRPLQLTGAARYGVIGQRRGMLRGARQMNGKDGMPAKAYVDAVHVATAAAHGIEYLLTWNCRHIANPMLRGRIEAICRETGFEPPVICTPVEFMQE